ncbi:probable xyloglucan galactosyltransferase GT15 [Physcomitrium patens]|uniref:Exostosin GT47 domain-containing protein n=1 Tax=Physcomitrium patens TaxID=3218 RepID=A0A2K1IYM0_PHYPA|nr:probable xyloglucan galactosyltransferase GT15 [Physcomitrium patens]XP_024356749.1 probable xyloglucan galactosyltransferase GT15 [Physcomitrium patens]XP_024356750.1 probable xyloglucan galactosyltransferase GT15 [Physcomitrium patens]PNR34361.1 hypothetical protein PHYPA_024178 [Physcomitrium patens]|eukprot:XP_024356748.1 probable xyloglucan galactosyltransferase GT15 [Physcomitrella patens]
MSQWHIRVPKGGLRHSKPKPSSARWVISGIFTLSIIFLYMTARNEWISAVENAMPISKVTEPSDKNSLRFSPVPTDIEGSQQVNSSSASTDAELLEKPVISAATSEVVSDIVDTTPKSDTLDKCDGRLIYIYNLAKEFNRLVVEQCSNWEAWPNMCEDISNQGFGVPLQVPASDPMASILQPPDAWFRTDQFTLEIVFHERLKVHPCLTKNSEEASLFYLPFYHGLDLAQNLYNSDLAVRDRLNELFVKWLRSQKPWQRHHGKRHVLVLGRIVWDFVRKIGKDASWGSSLLTQPELTNVTKLLIERSLWEDSMLGIPYPTAFHPSSESDLRAWQHTVRTFDRRQLVSLAGSTRTKKLTGVIRDEVFDQCTNSISCRTIFCNIERCVERPQIILKMGLESVFCLQPPGDSSTRKGVFDSLETGCIPVIFNKHQAPNQYLMHLPADHNDYSVLVPEEEVCNRTFDIMEHLSKIPPSEIARKQKCIVDLIPRLLYRHPKPVGEYTSRDAFDVAMDGLMARFDAEQANSGAQL